MRQASRRTVAFESLERRDLLSGDDMVEYRLALTDTSGQPLPTDVDGNPQVAVGQTFRLYGYSRDVRLEGTPPSNAKGVFASYMDVFYTNADLLTIRYGETQRLQFFPEVDSPAITGTFKLTFDGVETPDITYDGGVDYLAEKVQLELEALPNIGPGNVRVTVEPPNPKEPVNADTIRVQFLSALGERDLPEMTIDSAGLTNCDAAVVTQLYPGDDPTNPGTFRTAFSAVSPFINGLRAVDKTELEVGQDPGGQSFGGVGSFLDGFNSPGATAEWPFFSVDLKAVSPGVVEFSGNPSNSDVAPYEETDTLVFPSASTDTKLVVEPQYQGFVQDIENPLALTVLPRNVFTVDSTADTPDASPGDGLCADATGACTLRAAIQEANALANLAGGPDLIEFDIPGAGPHAIQPTSALPTITGAVVIDATTQPGYSGAPVVELDGSLTGAAINGLTVTAGSSTIRGLAINRFKGRGISVETLGGNTVAGNYIGTDVAGMLDRGNGSAGIFVNSGNNTIGGTTAADRNLISGNDRQGIYLVGGAAQNNLVLGNMIGTNALGTGAVPNNQYGVWVASPNNRIGGTDAGEGNLISGNRWGGVYVVGATAGGNVIQGNQIGTDASGTAKLANDGSGVMISLAPNNTVGGAVEGGGNVLSGNAQQGVYVLGGTATGNVVMGNRIGTNAAGTAAVGNSQNGVYLRGPSNRVGGTSTGEGNVISGNSQAGVAVFFADAASNVIEGNRIGTNAAGDAAIGNATYGVDLRLSPSALVGGTAAGAGNVISGNILAGVVIAGNTATGNQIQRNLIGTDFSGTADVGNAGSGILISSNALNNTIGGVDAGNVISGNNGRGIYFLGDAVQNNAVQGNLIGTDITGSTALANGNYGVWIAGKNNLIGGTVAGQGNVISGNSGGGIYLIQPWSGAPATENRIEGNKIGVNLAGAALGNQGAGVLLTVGALGNTVGGAGAGNVIARNTRQGIYVIGATSVRNMISQNSIYQNGDQGIDLSPYGVAANDPDDADTGPNKLQNFPVMSSAVLSGGTTLTISYSVPSLTINSLYPLAVEFFVADAAGQEGQTYLGGESYPAPGADSVVLTVGGVSAGQRIVATATDAQGNTSEFSANFVITSALQAPAVADGGVVAAATLDATALRPLVQQAIAAWESAGLDAARVAVLNSVSFEIADLPDRFLGWAAPDRIVLDIDAAGYGWYVADESASSNPESQMDLLTAVIHEMGHVLGLADLDDADELMGGVLQPGTRHLPTTADVDEILSSGDWLA